MKYTLIKDTMKVVSIKEVEIDKTNGSIIITSMKDEVYTEFYSSEEELLGRLLMINGGFNGSTIKEWWASNNI
jgi:hypothetical protein